MARTGVGGAVTEKIERFMRHERDIITVYDNPGFELGTDTVESMIGELTRVVRESRTQAVKDQIHAVWFVVNSQAPRFLDAHEKVVRAMAELSLPVMVVFTRVPVVDGEYEEEVLEFAKKIEDLGLPLAGDKKIIFLNAKETKLVPVHGLKELLNATMAMASEAARALKTTQRVDFSLQREEAKKIIRNFRYAATGAGATAAAPVPFADVAAVSLALGVMIAKISVCYALPIENRQVAAIAAAAVVGVGSGQKSASAAGEWLAKETTRKILVEASKEAAREGSESAAKEIAEIVAKEAAKRGGKQFGKFLPLVNVVFGAIGAISAFTLATAVGHAWMHLCEFLIRNPSLLRATNIMTVLQIFQHYFRPKSAPPGSSGTQIPDPELP